MTWQRPAELSIHASGWLLTSRKQEVVVTQINSLNSRCMVDLHVKVRHFQANQVWSQLTEVKLQKENMKLKMDNFLLGSGRGFNFFCGSR